MNISNFNGYRGEARTKAILSDSFVLIHTSIDEHGGDVLIRKIDDVNPSMSRTNMVVVQSKYVKNLKKGNIIIKKEYIEDLYNSQHFGFVIIVHTGEYDRKKVIFFNSEEIRKLIKEQKVKLNNKKEYIFYPSVLRDKKYNYTKNLKKINDELMEMLDKKECLRDKRKNVEEFKNKLGREIYDANEHIQNQLEVFYELYDKGGIDKNIEESINDLINDKSLIKIGEEISAILRKLHIEIEKIYKKEK